MHWAWCSGVLSFCSRVVFPTRGMARSHGCDDWLSSNAAVKPCSVLLPFEFAIVLLFCVVVFYHLPFNQNVAGLQGCRVGLRDLARSWRSWRDHAGSNLTTQHLTAVGAQWGPSGPRPCILHSGLLYVHSGSHCLRLYRAVHVPGRHAYPGVHSTTTASSRRDATSFRLTAHTQTRDAAETARRAPHAPPAAARARAGRPPEPEAACVSYAYCT